MAKRADDGKPLDPEGHYSSEDIVVWSDLDLPTERDVRVSEGLPVREVVYRLVRERGRLSLAELTRELLALLPGAARPPYLESPDAYVLRLVAGSRAAIPSLATFETMIRLLADAPPVDADYGLRVGAA